MDTGYFLVTFSDKEELGRSDKRDAKCLNKADVEAKKGENFRKK